MSHIGMRRASEKLPSLRERKRVSQVPELLAFCAGEARPLARGVTRRLTIKGAVEAANFQLDCRRDPSGRFAGAVSRLLRLSADRPGRFVRNFNRALGDLAAYVNHVVPVVAHQFALNGYEVRNRPAAQSCRQPINVLLEPVPVRRSGIRGIGLACRAPAQRRFRRALRGSRSPDASEPHSLHRQRRGHV